MMTLGPIGFMQPWVLTALIALPAIWWLLKLTPPRPERVVFPPTRLLKGLEDSEQTSAHSPWWLTALRMLLATLLICALAGPVLHPDRDALPGSGPVLLVVDNGWASATQWQARQNLIDTYISRAERDSRPVMLASTAGGRDARITAMGPQKAREAAASLQPLPYNPDRARLAGKLLNDLNPGDVGAVLWLTDGLDYGKAPAFAKTLSGLAGSDRALAIAMPEGAQNPIALRARIAEKGTLVAQVVSAGDTSRTGTVRAFTARGEQLGEVPFTLAPDTAAADAEIDLPLEIRNQIARLEISGETSAGAIYLLDARSHWRRIGIISGDAQELAQPLLSSVYYVERALTPYAEVVTATGSNIASDITELLARDPSVLVLADIGKIVPSSLEAIQSWVDRGGTLIRFSGPRLEKNTDQLLPTALRRGGRTLGGSLSWSTPQQLAPFEESSPFYGLKTSPEVTVRRQVLADPAAGPRADVWARLKDGTPLVSAARRGDGWLILFHVTANSDWSNLPISGLFVEMLRRVTERSVITSGGVKGASDSTAGDAKSQKPTGLLAPRQVLDGFGQLVSPLPAVAPIEARKLEETRVSPSHPPGYYGPAGATRALNLMQDKTTLKALTGVSPQGQQIGYEVQAAVQLKPWLLGAALVIFLADMIAVLMFSAGTRLIAAARGATATIAAVALAFGLTAQSLDAQQSDNPSDLKALDATLNTRLAYVVTGDAGIDQVSLAGLTGLSRVLRARTAIEPADPVGIDIEKDELAFYPLLYWPVPGSAKQLSEKTLAKIDAYMKQGGMIIFDTRDYQRALPSGVGTQGPGSTALSRLVGALDVPPLEPVPENHVLTKAFYLLKSFPGRWDGGALWVEATPTNEADKSRRARRTDGVSSLLITSNDFAAAWALDDSNRPLFPVVPGGEVQREMAFRVGVNIAMYALTGNYKADQVHVPALLERLGQ
ncbi:MAG: DUF4159 domain-containing protein [Hyphomicrobiaceae bacterium]|nr:DUF4159 domain-containing protein [Hyphomicrobiaceae bacterium]